MVAKALERRAKERRYIDVKEQKKEEAIRRDQEGANFPGLKPAPEPVAMLWELLMRCCCHPPRWLESK